MADLIMSNIDSLCKMQNKKKGDLDKHLGHTAGYLVGKKDGKDLTWFQLNEIAMFFGVPVQDLVSFDYKWEAEIAVLTNKIAELEAELKELNKGLTYALEMRDKANGRG